MTSHSKQMRIRRDVRHLFPAVDEISKQTPKIQDARLALARLAIREKAPLTELINYFLQCIPDQTFYCDQCHTHVPMYEFATDMCLDCVAITYQELLQ